MWFPELDYTYPMERFHYRIYRIDLKPFFAEVGAVGMAMVVILKKFTEHQKIKGCSVL